MASTVPQIIAEYAASVRHIKLRDVLGVARRIIVLNGTHVISAARDKFADDAL